MVLEFQPQLIQSLVLQVTLVRSQLVVMQLQSQLIQSLVLQVQPVKTQSVASQFQLWVVGFPCCSSSW